MMAAVSATANAQEPQSQELEEVIVTGFRQSLQDSTDAKRESVGFVDAIFAEDIGKFPDTNIAESFQRIPGIQISREISGEGTTVAIRGLNTNFTRVLLNNAPVAVASAPQEGPARTARCRWTCSRRNCSRSWKCSRRRRRIWSKAARRARSTCAWRGRSTTKART